MSFWSRLNSDRKDSTEFFLFLCNHTVNVHDNYLDILSKRRENILTVMSFCFIGGITFLGAQFEVLTLDLVATGFAIAFVALWLAAFLAVLIVSAKSNYYRIVPGKMDGISFLPDCKDTNDFRKSKINPFDADVFFIKRYLEENGHTGYDANDYASMLHEYQAHIRKLSDVEDMNKNAWLASLVHISVAQKEKVERTLRIYQWSYFALWTSLALLFVAIILCMF